MEERFRRKFVIEYPSPGGMIWRAETIQQLVKDIEGFISEEISLALEKQKKEKSQDKL